ncbi:FtsX-like permease family protein [Micromonospora viridifaciens]|uniref:FtsX-like permease family protein n=1 Tax=Micromonospora viridifaciens TaxID=1881 RepID=A0A1C4UK43_MICVI|nr:FtsX-like permease family protein [Micromonospora viridifaciens]SCE72025.1 FtsX-like permease family protein [Micromonospora viridifaciens]
MVRFVWSHLRGRLGRSLALLLGILVATTGFTVLTGTTETARLRVSGTLDANARAAYDILVRPKDARSALETDHDLVRPNHASGLFGGITREQLEQIRRLPDVELAAPIAMVGYTMVTVPVSFDVTDAVDPSLRQQVIRLDPTLAADRGLTRWPDAPAYVYVTRNQLIPDDPPSEGAQTACGSGYSSGQPWEVLPGGRKVRVCSTTDLGYAGAEGPGALNGLTPEQRTFLRAYQLTDGGKFRSATPNESHAPQDRLIVQIPVVVPILLAAIDVQAEALLTGVDRAVTAGRYLTSDEPLLVDGHALPVLGTAKPYLDQHLAVRYSRVDGTGVAGTFTERLRELFGARAGAPVGTIEQDMAEAYQQTMAELLSDPQRLTGRLNMLVAAGAPGYEPQPDGSLAVVAREADLDAYRSRQFVGFRMPGLALDTGFRPLSQRERPPGNGVSALKPVGLFDPEKLAGFSELSKVPLETYQAPTATGSDAQTRQLLGDRPLLPNGNPGGYLATPPFLLMDLDRLPDLGKQAVPTGDPISVIRVRVAGTDRYDKLAAERVRHAAEQIALATGLDVDITFGSSPTEQAVVLPAGKFQRPELRLTELWSRKGVASVIEQAIDRKSLLLFGLILLVCALFLGNAVAAAVRDRRRELAVLASLGWPARRLAAAILGEVALLGLAAGVLSLLLALPLAAAVGVRVPLGQAALAVPIGLLLALLAGLAPALGAARAHPATALRPAVVPARRARHRGTILGLAAANLRRVPGRTLLGAASLAVGICALTLLAAVQWAFRGDVQGSLLGDAVTLSVREVDSVAAVATVLLGLVGVADVLYLNIRDRAAEFATLRATGWDEAALGRLVTYEGLGIGLLGVLIGGAAGLGAAAWFVGAVPPQLIWAAVGTAAVGLLAAGIVALIPTLWLRRLPLRSLLAEE